jgi:hypothetical protein
VSPPGSVNLNSLTVLFGAAGAASAVKSAAIDCCVGGRLAAMAETVAGRAIRGVVLFFAWLVLVVFALILLAWIVHLAGGGMLDLRLGHFRPEVISA